MPRCSASITYINYVPLLFAGAAHLDSTVGRHSALPEAAWRQTAARAEQRERWRQNTWRRRAHPQADVREPESTVNRSHGAWLNPGRGGRWLLYFSPHVLLRITYGILWAMSKLLCQNSAHSQLYNFGRWHLQNRSARHRLYHFSIASLPRNITPRIHCVRSCAVILRLPSNPLCLVLTSK